MITILSALLIAPLIFLTLCFTAEVLSGLAPIRAASGMTRPIGSIVIVVPAHNEERILSETLRDLRQAADGCATIVVIADNCTDRTAAIARKVGVDVVERSDLELRGKGYALHRARSHLETAPPDIVVIIDADCTIDSRSLWELVARCDAEKVAVQAIYLQNAGSNATPIVQLSTFAFFIRNCVRQRGLQRLSNRVHLVGTGMAFPWSIFEKMDLATPNIVEDLHSGLELAAMGFAPRLAEGATVWTNPATQRSTFEQRQRWEGGYLQTARVWVPRLAAEGIRRFDIHALWAAASLAIPPMALLIGLDVLLLLLVSGAVWTFGASIWPAIILGCSLSAATLAAAIAWLVGGRRFLGVGALIQAPLYVAWKLPLYLKLASGGAPKLWQRTNREG